MQIRLARPADAAGLAKVHVDTWRTTYAGLVPADHLANLRYEHSAARWTQILTASPQTSYTYLAEREDGQIIGFAAGGPERENDALYDGELYGIYILKDWQGQGLGRQLTQTIAQCLLDEGFKGMKVWVLSGNNSRRFYETLGGQELYEKEIIIGGTSLPEVAYGWPDIRTLLPDQD